MAITLDALRNGLDLDRDLVLPTRPDHPEMRESTSIWMFDSSGRFGFPRMGIEAEAASWNDRLLQFNVAFADGRVLNGAGRGPAPSAIGPDGRPTILGAGPITFHCLEPFRRWSMSFDGPVIDSHITHQIAQTIDRTRTTHVRLDAELTMQTPAWIQQSDEATATLEDSLMGIGYRFEHLFTVTGSFQVDGTTHPLDGTGLRIHRQSIRRMEGFYGHCWQSALFPDGTAFGYIAYPPKPDGTTYNEGYVYIDGHMHPARAKSPPWLRTISAAPDDVSVELDYAGGTLHFTAHTTLSTFRIANPDTMGLTLQQSGVHYTLGTQTAYGMIERSSLQELTTVG